MADRTKTVDDIMAAGPRGPCDDYTRERVAEIVGDGITAEQCARLDIPIEDRLWAIINSWMDDRQCRLFAADCAERALVRERAAGREPDERSWEAIRVSRAYARGDATEEELAAARDAAWAAWEAAWDAARAALDASLDAVLAAALDAALAAARAALDAAGAAALDAAREAAWVAAWAAAEAAAREAAWDADEAAAKDAEREWQLQRALAYVRGHYGLELEQCRLTGGEHE
jgi:hypothetical protein